MAILIQLLVTLTKTVVEDKYYYYLSMLKFMEKWKNFNMNYFIFLSCIIYYASNRTKCHKVGNSILHFKGQNTAIANECECSSGFSLSCIRYFLKKKKHWKWQWRVNSPFWECTFVLSNAFDEFYNALQTTKAAIFNVCIAFSQFARE